MKDPLVLRQKYGSIVLSSGMSGNVARHWHYAFGLQKLKILLICDSNVYRLHQDKIEAISRTIPVAKVYTLVIEAGEELKNYLHLQEIWIKLSENNFTTDDVIIAVGGGTVTDLAGLAAATYKRGIRSVFVPTTLLAATDAALGGKNGINFNTFKNHIGCFHLPRLTYIDVSFFDTLSREEYLSGYAELFKHGLLNGGNFYRDVIKPDSSAGSIPLSLLATSIRFKLKITGGDPLEKGRRSILNFGHTLGHAFEAIMLEKGTPVTHGWAVAWGMQFALHFSAAFCGLNHRIVKDTMDILSQIYGTPPPIEFEKLNSFIYQDKKNNSKGLGYIILPEPGKATKTYVDSQIIEKEYNRFVSLVQK